MTDTYSAESTPAPTSAPASAPTPAPASEPSRSPHAPENAKPGYGKVSDGAVDKAVKSIKANRAARAAEAESRMPKVSREEAEVAENELYQRLQLRDHEQVKHAKRTRWEALEAKANSPEGMNRFEAREKQRIEAEHAALVRAEAEQEWASIVAENRQESQRAQAEWETTPLPQRVQALHAHIREQLDDLGVRTDEDLARLAEIDPERHAALEARMQQYQEHKAELEATQQRQPDPARLQQLDRKWSEWRTQRKAWVANNASQVKATAERLFPELKGLSAEQKAAALAQMPPERRAQLDRLQQAWFAIDGIDRETDQHVQAYHNQRTGAAQQHAQTQRQQWGEQQDAQAIARAAPTIPEAHHAHPQHKALQRACAAALEDAGFSAAEIKKHWEQTGLFRDARSQVIIAQAGKLRLLQRQFAEAREQAKRKPAPKIQAPGNRSGAFHYGDVERYDRELTNAKTTLAQVRAAAKLTKAKRARH